MSNNNTFNSIVTLGGLTLTPNKTVVTEDNYNAFMKDRESLAKSQLSFTQSTIDFVKDCGRFARKGYEKLFVNQNNKLVKPNELLVALTGLSMTQINDYLRFYNGFLIDENGVEKVATIGGYNVTDFSVSTALRLLPLKQEDREKAIDNGLTPKTAQKEARAIIDKVHSTKNENSSKAHTMSAEKKHEKAVDAVNSKPIIETVKSLKESIKVLFDSNVVKANTKTLDKKTWKKYEKLTKDFLTMVDTLTAESKPESKPETKTNK